MRQWPALAWTILLAGFLTGPAVGQDMGLTGVGAVVSVAVSNPVVTSILQTFATTTFNSGSPSTGSIADAPAGSLVVIGVLDANTTVGSGITGCVDSAGNTYSQAAASTPTLGYSPVSIWYVATAVDMPIGTTFTCTTLLGKWNIAAASVSGLTRVLDKQASNTAASTSISVSTGTLAASKEVVFSNLSGSGTLGTFTEGGGFTSFYTTVQVAANAQDYAYETVSATTSVTYNPSWTTSRNASVAIASFK